MSWARSSTTRCNGNACAASPSSRSRTPAATRISIRPRTASCSPISAARSSRPRRPSATGDIIPLPCNPESIAIGYALRSGNKIAPITSFFPKDMLVEALPNAITFEKYPGSAQADPEFLLAVDGGMQQPGKARRAAVLPAADPGARRHGLREHLPHRHRRIHGPAQFLHRPGQALLHPFRDAQRPDHSVRDLQHVLPRRGGAEADGGEQGAWR